MNRKKVEVIATATRVGMTVKIPTEDVVLNADPKGPVHIVAVLNADPKGPVHIVAVLNVDLKAPVHIVAVLNADLKAPAQIAVGLNADPKATVHRAGLARRRAGVIADHVAGKLGIQI